MFQVQSQYIDNIKYILHLSNKDSFLSYSSTVWQYPQQVLGYKFLFEIHLHQSNNLSNILHQKSFFSLSILKLLHPSLVLLFYFISEPSYVGILYLVFVIISKNKSPYKQLNNLLIHTIYVKIASLVFTMLPRTQSPQVLQPPLRSSPKFGSKMQINMIQVDPNFDRRVLIDQIINNCQRAESPLAGRKSFQSTRNSLYKSGVTDEKQNLKRYDTEQPVKGSRISYEYQINNNIRPVIEFHKEKRSSISSSGLKSSGMPQPINLQQQYYKKTLKQPNSPTYKLRIPADLPRPRRSNSNQKQIPQKPCLTIPKKVSDEQQKICKVLGEQRQKHLQYCKRQERKTRLYYVELENKLCELRSKQLKMLAEYQASKLKQYDQHINTVRNGQSNLAYEEYMAKIDEIKLGQIVKVNQSIAPEIQGCLYNGVSGIYFSFQQKQL